MNDTQRGYLIQCCTVDIGCAGVQGKSRMTTLSYDKLPAYYSVYQLWSLSSSRKNTLWYGSAQVLHPYVRRYIMHPCKNIPEHLLHFKASLLHLENVTLCNPRLLGHLVLMCKQLGHALQEYSDAMLSLMMSTITKGLYNVNEMVDKFNLAYDKLGRRRTPM